jgi:uncharacterized protein
MDLWLSFVAGMFGSLHCVGMCGPIVLAYATQRRAAQADAPRGVLATLPMHLLYNGGRVLSYAAVGAVVGALGGTITSLRGIGVWVSVVAGVVTIVAGVLLLGIFSTSSLWKGGERSWFRRFHLRTIGRVLALRSPGAPLLIGLLTPFLPCGLLYAMVISAAATGSAWNGAMMMLAFGAGIVPALLATGIASSFFGTRLRASANRIAAFTIILMGILLIFRGVGVPMPFMGPGHNHEHHSMPDPSAPSR